MVLANRNSPLASRPCRRLLAFTVAWTCLCFVFFRVYYAQHMDNVVQVWKFELQFLKSMKTHEIKRFKIFTKKYLYVLSKKKIQFQKFSVKLIITSFDEFFGLDFLEFSSVHALGYSFLEFFVIKYLYFRHNYYLLEKPLHL